MRKHKSDAKICHGGARHTDGGSKIVTGQYLTPDAREWELVVTKKSFATRAAFPAGRLRLEQSEKARRGAYAGRRRLGWTSIVA
jgi:hypothetical protein